MARAYGGGASLVEAAKNNESLADAFRRLGDTLMATAAEFRALEARWREENDG